MSNNPIRDTPAIGQKVIVDGEFIEQMQSLLEAYELAINSGKQNEYTLATVPDATTCRSCSIIVSDASIGSTISWSDGTNWKMPTSIATLS
jgi:hypothetical protein